MKNYKNIRNMYAGLGVILFSLTVMSCTKGIPVQISNTKHYTEDVTHDKGVDLSSNLETFNPENPENVVEGFRDPGFENGALLYKPAEGALVQDAILDFGYGEVSPVWTVAQWASKLSLSNSALEISPNGDRAYINAAKTLALNPDGSFKLELRGKYEYGSTVRKQGESWPHLYLTQAIYPAVEIPIAKCNSIFFSLDAIREYCHNYMGDAMDPSLHTAHIVINLIIQNRNRESPLYGKYFTFQLPVYDYRYDFPKGLNRYDTGGKEVVTGMLMYGPDADEIWDGTLKDGKWHSIRKNLLPMILEGYAVATQEGALMEGADMDDFYLAQSTIGWEVPGIFDASVRFKNYSIKAELRD
ncbi:hypothetical protein G5B00_07940 [Parapedobacter sp. SGR-10]|uniref:hypothetical protein n=1 Tax=Parapedobacter sp. SGR-10 TaxID=2710879 RepID=UPI0013D420C9|nr:hypothetical protein [Parapedobacter sp. SGR-10]NGF56446.1 hypothetical protein [Parapedobacter sp. SGR-10]